VFDYFTHSLYTKKSVTMHGHMSRCTVTWT